MMNEQSDIKQVINKIGLTLEEHASSQLYLLVDAAQFPQIWKLLESRYCLLPWLSLFEHTGNDEAIRLGPLLIHVDETYCQVLTGLLEHAQYSHCLSWIVSPLAHAALRDHLSALTDIETEDGTAWVMRYFDTRILPVWQSVLTDTQRHYAFGPVVIWGYYDRKGDHRIMRGEEQSTTPRPKDTTLTQAQENALLDAAYPDAIIQQLIEGGNGDLHALPLRDRYDFIAGQIGKARQQYQIESAPDTVLFCSLALAAGEEFDLDPAIAEMLKRSMEEKVPFGRLYLAAQSKQTA